MSSKTRPYTRTLLRLAVFAALLSISCSSPVVWNADVKLFVDDGTSTVSVKNFAAQNGGAATTVVPSGSETVVTLTMTNPRSLQLSCTASCADSTLLVSPPQVTVVSPQKITLAFTPALAAEHKDLVFTVTFAAPKDDRTYDPQLITIHCNSCPGSVESSLAAALDASGRAFAAFRLPSSPTDNDLSQFAITYQRADGSGSPQAVTLGVADPSLLQKILSVDGRNLLGTDSPLNRYFQPTGINTGVDYIFSVVVVDTEGLRSQTATTTSNATLYSVTYDGNGDTGGAAPVDLSTHRQTMPVTVLGQGTLTRTGYTFAGWNTAADGSGTSYSGGDTFAMPAANVTLYAVWNKQINGGITINQPPIYTVTISGPTTLNYGSQTTFTSSYAGTPSTYAWYLDSSTTPIGTASTLAITPTVSTYTYGGHLLLLVVTDINGFSYTGSVAITVQN